MSFSPDGDILASGHYGGIIKLWNTETGEQIRIFDNRSNYSEREIVDFSPDGNIVVSGNASGGITWWSVEKGEEIHSDIRSGHDGGNPVSSVEFSPDGNILASGGEDGTIKLWSVGTGNEIITLRGHDDVVHSISFSPHGKVLASSSNDGTIKLWNLEKGRGIDIIGRGNESRITESFNLDGNVLALVSNDGTVMLWNVETGEEIITIPVYFYTVDGVKYLFKVRSVIFSNEAKVLALIHDDQAVKLWDVEKGEEFSTIPQHTYTSNNETYIANFGSAAFSHDGKILSLKYSDGTIKRWDIEKGEEVKTFQGNEDYRNLSFNSDGRLLTFSISENNIITLWDAEKGEQITTFQRGRGSLEHVDFNSDGELLAYFVDEDSNITLWDIEKGEQISTFPINEYYNVSYGSSAGEVSAKFSLDGTMLTAFTGQDYTSTTFRLWDIVGEEEIFTLQFAWYDMNLYSRPNDIFLTNKELLVFDFGQGILQFRHTNLNFLIKRSCDRIRNYLKYNPNVKEEDKRLCDGIGMAD